MSDTKTITILKSTVCGLRPVEPGDVVQASPADASFLVATRRAMYGGDIAKEDQPKRGRKKSPENRMIGGEELDNRGVE